MRLPLRITKIPLIFPVYYLDRMCRKGELLRDTGNLLKEKGYDIKVLDLINMEKSHCYNPFVNLKSDNDIQCLVTNLF